MLLTFLSYLYARLVPAVILFEGPAAGGGGGSAPAGGSPAGGTPSTPSTPSSPTSPAGGAPSAPAAAAPAWSAPSYKDKAEYDAAMEAVRTEARRGFVPSHRLVEETTKRQGFERDLTTAQQRIRALSGLETLSPEQAEAQRVREAFLVMFPEFRGLMALTPDKIAALERAVANGSNADEVVRHHWDNHAATVFNTLAEQVETALGAERLTERQFNSMVNAFRGWSREQMQTDPRFRQRYESADPALLAAFVKDFTEDWIAPSRRQALTTVTGRPRVPAGGRTPAVTAPPPNLENIKTPEDAEDAGIQYMRDRGVAFRG